MPLPPVHTDADSASSPGEGAAVLLPSRVLIIRPSALGDVCRSVPLAASLHAAWPQARVEWLVQDAFAPAVAAHPGVGGVVPFARSRLGQWFRPGVAVEAFNFVRGLAGAKYDVVIDAQGLLRSGVFALATRARLRVGFENAREMGWLGTNIRVPAPRSMHAVDRMLKLLEPLGVPALRDLRLYVPPDSRAAGDRDERLRGRFALLAPTSRWPGKRWATTRFVALARALLDAGDVERVVLVGSKSERPQCAPLLDLCTADPRVIDLLGGTTVGGLMDAVARAAVVVGNDSAVLHMAVGLDRPLVGLYGPTDVARVGPYGRSAWVIQHVEPGERLAHKDEDLGRTYMDRISVDEVVERTRAALAGATL